MAIGEPSKKSNALFIACFLTLIAAGIGFSVRGAALLEEWESDFKFTKSALGGITGGGLVGFGVTIILCSFIADAVGFKVLMIAAFLLHVGSVALTVAAGPIYQATGQNQDAVYWCLYFGMFMFALGNGLCEAVINPLVASLYPKQKTHYLNILHAGWPGGLVLGAIIAYCFVGRDATIYRVSWETSICFFLVPVLLYGILMLGQKFPVTEAKAAGVDYGTMLAQLASPILLLLLLLQAMVGYVELGTDSWITEILKGAFKGNAILLFIYASGIMFVLRFFAGPIVEHINPVGLLLLSAVLGCIGLFLVGSAEGLVMVIFAYTVYAVGKTFLWPTMLGVVGDRFPKGGSLIMGLMGGVGMLSAGLLGGPGIGYKQDYYASSDIKKEFPNSYENYLDRGPYSETKKRFLDDEDKVMVDGKPTDEWVATVKPVIEKTREKHFLFFPTTTGLSGKILGDLKNKEQAHEKAVADEKKAKTPEEKAKAAEELAKSPALTDDDKKVLAANEYGGRTTLKVTAFVPLMMAIGYLVLLFYFKKRGGYKTETVHDGERYTGGVEGPIR